MERSELHFQLSLRLVFDVKKPAAEAHRTLLEAYGNTAPSCPNWPFWFQRVRSGCLEVCDKEQPGRKKKFGNNEL